MRALPRGALIAGLAVLASGCVMEPRSTPESRTPSFYRSLAQPGAAVDSITAQAMIGAYRRNRGLEPIALDPDLQAAAEAEAKAMAAAEKPASADTVKGRLSAQGFKAPAANLSAGYHTLAEAFSGWRDSPQHNGVLLDPAASRMGIATAYAPGSKYKVYWVLVTAAGRA
jgi:uncharacterized protein YkwD